MKILSYKVLTIDDGQTLSKEHKTRKKRERGEGEDDCTINKITHATNIRPLKRRHH